MARSKSSTQWLKEHFNDPYVKRAQQEGWRSRAAYKLLEIQKKRPILKQGMTVVDLGAAPGGWTQVAASLIGGGTSRIIALDVLPMDPYGNATVIQGDFTDAVVHEQLLKQLDGKKVDLVLCDMAPNMSGNKSSDQLKMMYLLELAYDFAKKVLAPKGYFLMKAFYGEGFDVFLRQLKIDCAEVKVLKPDASRSRSAECYVLVQGVNASEKRV
jgi:23S rRNA (uridine2552-2'-O)-methyltransferase